MTTNKNTLREQGAEVLPRLNFTKDCPRFQTCNAAICPIDPDWRNRKLLSEDSTCFYLIESVKEGGAGNFEGAGLGELYRWIVGITPEITTRHRRLFRILERAKLTGSRMTRKFGGG